MEFVLASFFEKSMEWKVITAHMTGSFLNFDDVPMQHLPSTFLEGLCFHYL